MLRRHIGNFFWFDSGYELVAWSSMEVVNPPKDQTLYLASSEQLHTYLGQLS